MHVKQIREGLVMHRLGHPTERLRVLALDEHCALVRVNDQRRIWPLQRIFQEWVANQDQSDPDGWCEMCFQRRAACGGRICDSCARAGER